VSKQADIIAALVASLDAVTWTATADPVTVETQNFPQYDLENAVNPLIFVTDGGIDIDRLSRSAHQRDYQIQILLARHTPTEAACDVMLDLLEELLDKLEEHSWGAVSWPTGISSPQSITVEKNPDEALVERNVWRAGLVVTYRYPRAH
jgi:hypothetical protein